MSDIEEIELVATGKPDNPPPPGDLIEQEGASLDTIIDSLPLEEREKRREILHKIKRFIVNFPEELKEWKFEDIEAITNNAKLDIVLQDIISIVDSDWTEKSTVMSFMTAARGLEAFAGKMGYPIDGFTSEVCCSKFIQRTLTKIAILDAPRVMRNPYGQIALGCVLIAYNCHAGKVQTTKSTERCAASSSKGPSSVTTQTKEEFKDL